MNQEKIGKFIQELRKEKKMTQQELADLLNVTDRAISHWENGRRMPDVSLFKPICEIFNISVNELISGERISLNEEKGKYEENIIESLNINKKNKSRLKQIIVLLFIILFGIIVFIYFYYNYLFPKFDIYNVIVSSSDINSELSLKKQFNYKNNNVLFNVWYYGIDSVQLCDVKNKCFLLEPSIKYKQIDVEKMKKYLNYQYKEENIDKFVLYDGNSILYLNDKYSILFCDTVNDNKDIYIGLNSMIKDLNGSVCDNDESIMKRFTKTYTAISVVEDDDYDYLNVTLKEFQGETAMVRIKRVENIENGKNYEFTFINYYEFDDDIKNIFDHAILVDVKETNRVGLEQINESIYKNLNR